jgi:hypothetical protein
LSADTSVCWGESVTFSGSAAGGTGMSYQWQESSDNISWSDIPGPDAKSETYSATITATKYYRLKATNEFLCASFSAARKVTVKAPPSILSDPQDAAICATDSVLLTVGAIGGAPLSYQWRISDNMLSFANIGTNSSSYNTGSLTSTHYYKVVVTNNYGCSI